MFATTLFAVLLAVSCSEASKFQGNHQYPLKISNKVISPDGFDRSAVLANDVFPAPLIKGKKGQNLRVNVVNTLTDDTMLRSTSIHWHGIFQRGTAYYDGVAGVTQCPISPNNSFLYQFPVDDQAGTFWYHSHFGTQYCDGLRGPLVVYDPRDPHRNLYDVDDESTVMTVGDWYHTPSPSIIGIAISDATLINGKGRFPGGPMVDLAVVNIQHGKRYRMRLVSISCDPNYIFSIDGHQLTIIEADGENTQPLTVDSIQIFAGQRYSFILHANQPVGNYWIRALPSTGNSNLSTGFTGGINSAILRYKGASLSDPQSSQNQGMLLSEANLHPLTNPPAPGQPFDGGADVNINLALDVDLAKGVFLVNGKSYVPPAVPVLLQILSGAHTAQELLPQGSIYTLPRNKTIEVTIPGGVIGGPHPFHLHGHSFSVIRSAGNDTAPNYDNPVRRDVVSIGDIGSNVTIRFNTDNPGPWMLHCHIDWHLNVGLAVVFAEDTDGIKEALEATPSSWSNLCPTFDALPTSLTSVTLVNSTDSTPAGPPPQSS